MGWNMSHRYSTGQNVYYDPQFGNNASRGKYKIVRQLPIERDNRLSYRIKSTTELFRADCRGTPVDSVRTQPRPRLRSSTSET